MKAGHGTALTSYALYNNTNQQWNAMSRIVSKQPQDWLEPKTKEGPLSRKWSVAMRPGRPDLVDRLPERNVLRTTMTCTHLFAPTSPLIGGSSLSFDAVAKS